MNSGAKVVQWPRARQCPTAWDTVDRRLFGLAWPALYIEAGRAVRPERHSVIHRPGLRPTADVVVVVVVVVAAAAAILTVSAALFAAAPSNFVSGRL